MLRFDFCTNTSNYCETHKDEEPINFTASSHIATSSTTVNQENTATTLNENNQNAQLMDVSQSSTQIEDKKNIDDRKCKICFENLANMLILPCSHLGVCETCTAKLKQCPFCRIKIQKVIKTYMV